MRTIKFRAWNKEQNIMVQVRTLFFNGDGSIKAITLWTEDLDGCIYIPKLKNIILMQYTGLKDKNGKEIYEGDIIEHWDNNYIVPEFIPLSRSYEAQFIGEKGQGTDDWMSMSDVDWEVVGNIYQNPELIK